MTDTPAPVTSAALARWASRARSLRNVCGLSAFLAFFIAYALATSTSAEKPSPAWTIVAGALGGVFTAGVFAAPLRPFAASAAFAIVLFVGAVVRLASEPFDAPQLLVFIWPLAFAGWARELRGADRWIRRYPDLWKRVRRDRKAIADMAASPGIAAVVASALPPRPPGAVSRVRSLAAVVLVASLGVAAVLVVRFYFPVFHGHIRTFESAWNARSPARLAALAPRSLGAALLDPGALAGWGPKTWPRLEGEALVTEIDDYSRRVEFALRETQRRLVTTWRLEDAQWTIRSIAVEGD